MPGKWEVRGTGETIPSTSHRFLQASAFHRLICNDVRCCFCSGTSTGVESRDLDSYSDLLILSLKKSLKFSGFFFSDEL